MHITSGSRTALAAVLAAVVLLLATTATAQDNDARKEAAASMYKVAVGEFGAGNYAEALDKLAEVYELDPNPVILYNIGRCYEELGQLAEAAEYFQRAAADDTLPEQLYAEVGKRLPKLMPALRRREARGIVSATVASGLTRGEEEALQAYVNTKERIVAPVTPAGPDPVFLWSGVATAGVGVVLLGVGAVVDVGLADPIDELKDPQTRRDAARTKSLQDEIDSGQTLAVSMYLAGAAAVIAGGVLVTLGFMDGAEAPPAEGAALRWGPTLAPGMVGFQFGGQFQ
jgi:tetratricopeptide (TPR) repeat protein